MSCVYICDICERESKVMPATGTETAPRGWLTANVDDDEFHACEWPRCHKRLRFLLERGESPRTII